MSPTLSPADARRILEALLSRGGDRGELFLEEVRSTSLALRAGLIDEAAAGIDAGVGMRLELGEVTWFANGNDLSQDALLALARGLAAALPGDHRATTVPPLAVREVAQVSPVLVDPGTVALDRKVSLLERVDRAARAADPRVVQVDVRYRDATRTTCVARSDGRLASDRVVQTSLFVAVSAREGTVLRRAVRAAAGTAGLELFDTETPESLGAEAARVACSQLAAGPAPAGEMPVVLGAMAGGTFVHEACGHALEADFVDRSMSVFAERVGQPIASPLVTVVDDGTLPGRRGSFGVDDEGTPSARTVLVERGVLRGFLHSLRTARRLAQPPTGSGRRESYRHLPIPRMRNTLILPGEDDPQAIVASVEEGLYVADMGGGEVDVVTGNFVFHCTEAYRIRGGRLAEPVRDAMLTGNAADVLPRIDRVGRDLGFQVGTCGKEGQGVPVADAQPTLRISRIVVGGRAG